MAFNQNDKILADVDGGLAGSRGSGPRRSARDPGNCPDRLSERGSDLELAGPMPAGGSDKASPSQTCAVRKRCPLESIIRLANLAQAEELAARLLQRFGSVGDVLAARKVERQSILGDWPEVERALQDVRLAIDDVLRGRLVQRRILSTDQAVLDYLRANMAFEGVERFRVLFLNAANALVSDEELGCGTVSAVHAYPREIVRRCLELGATAMLLVHNHPSGDPTPSAHDKALTACIVRAAACFGIQIHDHLIVARTGTMSFRQAGYL